MIQKRVIWLALGLLVVGVLVADFVRPSSNEASSASVRTTPRATATSLPTATTVPSATAQPEPTVTATFAPTVAPTVIAGDVNDTPHLSEEIAPTAAIQQVEAPTASQPVRLEIPAIGLDYEPVSVGLDEQRVPIVPQHDIGWYNLSAMPGQGDNIVFWGHVLRFKAAPNIPAPFARVKELQTGAEIIVTNADGAQMRYRVREAVQVTPDQVQYILPTGKEQLTLVSCIGDKVVEDGYITKKYRLVTIAEPVQ